MARPIPEYRVCPSCGVVRMKVVYTKRRDKARLRYFRCRACGAHARQSNRGQVVLIVPKSTERKPHTAS